MTRICVKLGAFAVVLALSAAAVAGCVPAEDTVPSNLELPQVVWDALERMMPRAVVEQADVPAIAVDTLELGDDKDVSNKELFMRPVVINIHNLDEALAVVESLGGTSKVTVFGTFAITDEMMARIQEVIDGMETGGAEPSFLLLDLETAAGLAYNLDGEYHSGTGAMGFNMTGLCALVSKAFGSSSAGIESSVKYSSEDAYEAVFDNYDKDFVNKWRKKAGLEELDKDADAKYPTCTTREFAQLWLANWDYLKGTGDAPKQLRAWMEASRLSAFANELGGLDGYTNCSKPGWDDDNDTCCEGGYVVTADGTYLLCIMYDGSSRPDEALADLVKVFDEAYREYVPLKIRD